MVLKQKYLPMIFLVLFIIEITSVQSSIRENLKKIFSHKNETSDKDKHEKEEATSFLDELTNKIISKKNQLTDMPKMLKEQLMEKIHEELRVFKYLVILIATTSTIAAITGTYLCASSIFIQINKKIKAKKYSKNDANESIEMKQLN